MLATIASAALQGIDAELVHVEVNTGEAGEPKLILVGLPDAAVKESDDRVFSAMSNSGFKPPRTRTTINLAPGNLRKEGPFYDLPIALGILAATKQLHAANLDDWLIAGELSLSGATRPVRGALAMARLARKLHKRGVLLPAISAEEAVLVEGIEVYRIDSLDRAVRFLSGEVRLDPLDPKVARRRALAAAAAHGESGINFSEIKGQQALRRAVEVAVAGNHNLLMIGPPGSGKSMIAKRIPTIMPAPTPDERLEILGIHSAAGRTISGETAGETRPFRSPHHTVSDVALLGGGTIPGPGEISLAHHGVLFLDELAEFKRSALEVLRQPLEDGDVTISRSAGKITLPCAFMLVAAMNPCPNGFYFYGYAIFPYLWGLQRHFSPVWKTQMEGQNGTPSYPVRRHHRALASDLDLCGNHQACFGQQFSGCDAKFRCGFVDRLLVGRRQTQEHGVRLLQVAPQFSRGECGDFLGGFGSFH